MKPGNHENNLVLIVDDQQEIHDDFREMLEPCFAQPPKDDLAAAFLGEEEEAWLPEFDLLHAYNGEDACATIRRGKESNRPISVAYIDIRMPPGIDGIETIRRIRTIDRDVEIVIMTAYTDKALPEIVHDMELLHKLLYIRKPFSHEEVQQITVSLAGKWNIERQLTNSHRRLEAVLNATGDAIAMHDSDGRLVFANRAYEELLGLMGSELREIPPRDLAARFEERFREPDFSDVEGRFLLESGSFVESTSPDHDPRQRLFYRSTAPVRDGGGEKIGRLVTYRDVSREIEAEQMKAEVLRLRSELKTTSSFADMVGTSPGMQEVYALMEQAAKSDIGMLIRGESGTGKELVAKSVHLNGPRKQGPFVAVNCAAIPETLIESELFGHERGAFTGATEQRTGAFERADKGTILLDEIGDMPVALQGKLLRVLQEREVQRVGGTAPIPVDIRVMTATNKDLERSAREGKFRQDLFYRVSAFPIAIPPLRDRREDIPLLARHFLEIHAEHAGKSISGLSTAAQRMLLQYDWPGNVRELENAIQRAVLLEGNEVLQAGNLPPQLSTVIAGGSSHPPPEVRPLAELERQALVHALETTGNDVMKAAEALGIDRATLYRKLKKYDLSRG